MNWGLDFFKLQKNLRNQFDGGFRRAVAERGEMSDQYPHLRGSEI